MKTKLVLIILLGVAAALPVAAQEKISVTQYGIVPNTFTDVSGKIQKAIEACRNKPGAILDFPAGRYDFWPEGAVKKAYYTSNTTKETDVPDKVKTIGLLFESINDITIEGNGSEFIFHGKMTPWALVNCRNIQMQNLAIDFERPSMSEMTFKEITSSSVTATIHPDSKFAIINNRLQWYGEGWGMNNFHAILTNPATGINTYSSWNPFRKATAEIVAPQTVRFTGDFSKFKAVVGDVLTIRDAIRDQVGGFINLSKNISFKNLKAYYMHGFGILSQFSENISFDSLTVAPRPGSGRTMSSFADALHFSGCKGEIKITNSFFKGMHDDPINVHGTHLKITQIVSSTQVKVKFMHPETYGFEAFFAGDSIALVHSESLQVFAQGIVKTATLISKTEMLVELMQPVANETAIGDCLENITWTPSLTVRNSRFESVNTRGLLVTTRKKILIEGNTFYRTGMHAILIANDALSWYESGPVQDVTIRNNIFEECGYNSAPGNYIIAIAPEDHKLVEGYYVHRNIRVENNVFKVYDVPLLTARSTDGLVFNNNIINQSHLMPQSSNKKSIQLTACKNVFIKGNVFNTGWQPAVNADKVLPKELNTDIKYEINKPAD